MTTTNAGTFDSTAAGRAVAIALLVSLSPEARAKLARIRNRRQNSNRQNTEGNNV